MHIADTVQGASAPTHDTCSFDPAAWLARYVELGGGYTVTSGIARFHRHCGITQAQQAALAHHERRLRADLANRDAVEAHILSMSVTEEAEG